MNSRTSLQIALLSLVPFLFLCAPQARGQSTEPTQEDGQLGPHDFRALGRDCRSCHKSVGVKSGGGLIKSVGEICSGCHRVPGLSHPVDIVPTIAIPADLPLDENGKMTCATCHDPHRPYINPMTGQKTRYLRRDGPKRILCLACHNK